MAFQPMGIPSFNLGTVKAAPRPRRRRGGGRGQGDAMAMAPTMDRNYEQQIDEREQRQALERIDASKPKQKPAAVKRAMDTVAPEPYVSGEQEWAQMGGKTLAQIATEDPGQAANRYQSLIDFAGELMSSSWEGISQKKLPKSMVAQLPGFVSSYAGAEGQQPRTVFAQREKTKSGDEIFAFYQQAPDGAVQPVLHQDAPWRLKRHLVENMAKVAWLGRKRVNALQDQKREQDLAKIKAGSLTAAQRANNAEIDAARQAIEGLGRDDILKRTQAATATGRDNPDFDPYLSKLVKTATQRKVGDDPDFEATFRRYFGQAAAPAQGLQPGAVVDGFRYRGGNPNDQQNWEPLGGGR